MNWVNEEARLLDFTRLCLGHISLKPRGHMRPTQKTGIVAATVNHFITGTRHFGPITNDTFGY